ncbi:hypothetical protein Bca4012_036713 [Brassica carinata]
MMSCLSRINDWQVGFQNLHCFLAKETGELPSLLQLYERIHKNKADRFVDARSEQIFHDLVGWVEDRQTQLTQQSTDRLSVTLSTLEVDRLYEEVVHKKKGRTLRMVPSMMFRERHRLMARDRMMKSLSCVTSWTRRDLRSQLVWVESRASWTL